MGGETLLLIRVEDLRGISHLLAARSADGVTDWRFDAEPLIKPEPDLHPEEIWGCEDPRLTWLPELDQWAIAYTAYSRRGPLVSLALSHDFTEVRKLGPVMPPEDKDAALFPRRIDGRWAMIHRPSPIGGFAHMWISYSPDLRHWGDHELLLEARDGAWWDAGKIGLGPPPLETSDGWLVCYHGVKSTASGPYLSGRAGAPGPRRATHGPAPDGRVGALTDGVVRAQRRRQQGGVPDRLGTRPDDPAADRLLRRGRLGDSPRDGRTSTTILAMMRTVPHRLTG